MSPEQAAHPTHAPRSEWLLLLAVFLVGFFAILSRKPDALYNPQFYIEDGRDWYAQAHDLGPVRALTITHKGYFVLAPRLGAMLALLFPLAWAPLVTGLLGAALDVLPAVFVASSRFAYLVPSLPRRLFLGLLCLAAPNAWTLMTGMTNAIWYLALLTCMVVVARPSERRSCRAFDLGVVLLSGLSGPYSIMLTPVAALTWWLRRERWSLVLLLATAATGLAQAASILVTPGETRMQLGADALKLGKLLVKRVIYEALFGQVGGERILSHAWGDFWTHRAVLGAVALAGLAVLVYAMLRAPLELRLFIGFAGLTLLAALAWPGGTPVGAKWWDLLMGVGNGNRYFLLPVLAFLVTCAWMASVASPPVRALGVFLLSVAVAFGVRLNWREPPYPNFDFPASARRYKAAAAGERVLIMTPPEWAMVLTKKPGEPVLVEPDECAGGMPVAATLLASNQMTWNGRRGRSEGGDAYAVFGLPSRQYVCGVRVRFILTSPGDAPALVQVFWAESAEAGFGADERNSYLLVNSDPASQTAVVHVRDTIDRIRIDPGTTPGCAFELEEVVLLP